MLNTELNPVYSNMIGTRSSSFKDKTKIEHKLISFIVITGNRLQWLGLCNFLRGKGGH